jgi:hypothetical protein
VIKGSTIMGFTDNPQQCLDVVAGDLRMMGCAIFYKRCQEVDTVTSQILIGAPKTIEEEIIKQMMDKELQRTEKKLLLTNKDYKLTREQSKNWMSYAVVKDFPVGMPREGAEEKKEMQGSSNSRLAYVLHVHQLDFKQMKTLLAYAKDKNIWHKKWGHSTFTIDTPENKDSIGSKTKYIQMVQTHGSIQLSMGAAMIKGMIDMDTVFNLQLFPGADGKPRSPTKTSVNKIFSMMEINENKVWICLSTGTNGITTGYFFSIVAEIRDHMSAFGLCPAAQVYW